MYIAIEGIDTAGKSTQIEALRSLFPDALITKEPGGTTVGTEIRNMVLHGNLKSKTAELLLFLADRAEHTESVILPNMNKLIISDRSAVSGMAYASVQNLCDEPVLVMLNRLATGGTLPDTVFILKLTSEELSYRLSQKEHDVIESRGTEYLLGIQDALIASAYALGIQTVVIDATQSIDTITKEITTFIKGAL
ncbi:thymidylate kinase [Sulfuricurvum kujiense DSM 16994]|uniref:Thymidylate kinase n=1 Tax=Sulfuricurvum kujiense (strain ATCC BAA-921 / DSM 16994 / JCM 11577 / YK-1) TaxID=709032 RepID=E4TXI9_SULKY|nr:dTMP kinase [Sulfuricurvum kujiense]ADR33898.1 thymidylate kinase [Sulfuricurvum kujiense DSM 16994]